MLSKGGQGNSFGDIETYKFTQKKNLAKIELLSGHHLSASELKPKIGNFYAKNNDKKFPECNSIEGKCTNVMQCIIFKLRSCQSWEIPKNTQNFCEEKMAFLY